MALSAEIRSALERRAAILTANARAARWLEREYALAQRALGRSAWDTATITDWDSWLRGLWMEHALKVVDAPLLLTRLQERGVWSRMMGEDARRLLSPSAMSALAESAYALLSGYEAQDERRRVWGKTDAERFQQWAAAFERECARRNWASRAGLERRVAAVLDAKALPGEVLLVGFDRLTPAQNVLISALAEHGVSVHVAESAAGATVVQYRRASGLREELTACAAWARARLEANPVARIGFLVPDLGAVRAEMERAFRRVLAPGSNDIFASRAMPFEFSLGLPLAHVPVIRAALLLLRWMREPLSEEEATWLLLSGFAGESSEYLALARADAERRNWASISPDVSLGGILSSKPARECATLRTLADVYKGERRMMTAERSSGEWVDWAQTLLERVGWPGRTEQGTLTFQAVRRWERALDEMALLDFDSSRMKLGEFLHTLGSHALESIFAPESEGAPVQIMGANEAAGQRFDALWFLGVDDAGWPPRGRPHPLLPDDVQRRHRMPYGDPENDLELAKAVTARIAASAPEVVFSYAACNPDGELRPSPLLPRNAAWQMVEAERPPHPKPRLEGIEEPVDVALWPLEQTPGGSETLKMQAACPFQAFAAKRLRAEPLNRAERGLTAAERGSLLHKTLENIWSPEKGALHTLEDLKAAKSEGTLEAILKAAVESAFAGYDAVDESWMRAYLDSEKARLCLRLGAWMEVEERRQPFEVIACEERLDDVDVGGLHLRLRVDRVDQLPNFDRLLLDYKTSVVATGKWEGLRPDEPQVPLYAVFGGVDDLQGVLFAQIRAGATKFIGSVADAKAQLDSSLTGSSALVKNPYTETMRDEWRIALLNLADDFLLGKAVVDPKHGVDTCKVCSFAGLCRVAETRDGSEGEDERMEGGDGESAS